MLSLLKDLAWNSGKKYFGDSCPQLAAAITYYVVFSIFPFMIFAASVAGIFLDEEAEADLVNEILKWIPLDEEEARDDIESAVNSLTSSGARIAGLISLGVLLWSSSSMFNSIRRALNIVFALRDEHRRPWVPQKLIDLCLVLGLGLFFVSSMVTTMLLQVLQERSEDLTSLGRLADDLGLLWNVIGFVVPAFLAFVGFGVLYVVAPSRTGRPDNVWPGALFAAVVFQTAITLFSWYIRVFTDYTAVYGSIATIVVFLFWVYLSAQIMLMGGVVASVYPHAKAGEFRPAPDAPLGKPLVARVRDGVVSLFVKRSSEEDSKE